MKNIFKLLFCFALLVIFVRSDFAKPKAEDYSIAYINEYDGQCEVKRRGETISEAVGDIYVPLYEGDAVITDEDSRMEVVFDDSTIVKLDPNSRLVIKNLKRVNTAKTVLELIKGRIFGIVKKLMNKEEFTVRTKLAMAAIKGTELVVETGDQDKVGVYEGAVAVSHVDMSGNVLNTVIVNKNNETVLEKYLHGPQQVRVLSSNFTKRYRELKDLRQKIEYLRELRHEGRTRQFKLKRRLDRIQNLKMMMRSDPKHYQNLSPDQKALMDEIIKEEPYYQAQYNNENGGERKTKLMIKKYMDKKKENQDSSDK
jgi:hypothetical protein